MPRHSPYALVRLNFFYLVLSILELLEFLKQIFVTGFFFSEKVLSFSFLFPPFGEIVFTLFGKTLMI